METIGFNDVFFFSLSWSFLGFEVAVLLCRGYSRFAFFFLAFFSFLLIASWVWF